MTPMTQLKDGRSKVRLVLPPTQRLQVRVVDRLGGVETADLAVDISFEVSSGLLSDENRDNAFTA